MTPADVGVPVTVTLHWMTGGDSDVDGIAVAWTRQQVQLCWSWNGEARLDWVSAADVRRR